MECLLLEGLRMGAMRAISPILPLADDVRLRPTPELVRMTPTPELLRVTPNCLTRFRVTADRFIVSHNFSMASLRFAGVCVVVVVP